MIFFTRSSSPAKKKNGRPFDRPFREARRSTEESTSVRIVVRVLIVVIVVRIVRVVVRIVVIRIERPAVVVPIRAVVVGIVVPIVRIVPIPIQVIGEEMPPSQPRQGLRLRGAIALLESLLHLSRQILL